MRHTSFCGLILAATLFAASLPTAAGAQDATAVANLLVALTKRAGGSEAKYASATSDGGSVVINGFYTRLKDGDADVQFAEIRLADPVVESDGGLSASAVVASGIAMASGQANITINEVVTKDVRYPSPDLPEKEFIAATKSAYSSIEAHDIVVVTEQRAEVPIARIAITNADIVGGIAHNVSFQAEGIVVDPQTAGDLEAREKAKALGYDKITLGAAFAARWDEDASVLHVDKFEFGGKDVGYLRMSASIGGITRAMSMSTSQEEASQHLQGVTLNAASIRFENDSIVERSLAQQAAEEGKTPEAMIDETLVQLPDMMAVLGNPDLAAQATEALSTFLRTPKNLSVETRLEAGIPVMQIVGMAMMAPPAAVEMLKLEIKANE